MVTQMTIFNKNKLVIKINRINKMNQGHIPNNQVVLLLYIKIIRKLSVQVQEEINQIFINIKGQQLVHLVQGSHWKCCISKK
jgi:hypothetical protein